jgi:hypothetical protein
MNLIHKKIQILYSIVHTLYHKIKRRCIKVVLLYHKVKRRCIVVRLRSVIVKRVFTSYVFIRIVCPIIFGYLV